MSIGSGKIKTEVMAAGERSMKFKTGPRLVRVQQRMLSGIMARRICTELVLKAWLVVYMIIMALYITFTRNLCIVISLIYLGGLESG